MRQRNHGYLTTTSMVVLATFRYFKGVNDTLKGENTCWGQFVYVWVKITRGYQTFKRGHITLSSWNYYFWRSVWVFLYNFCLIKPQIECILTNYFDLTDQVKLDPKWYFTRGNMTFFDLRENVYSPTYLTSRILVWVLDNSKTCFSVTFRGHKGSSQQHTFYSQNRPESLFDLFNGI